MDKRLNPEGLILEDHYAETMRETVLPFLKSHSKAVRIKGTGGRPLYAVRYQPEGAARGTVLIVHGFTENAAKFSELIFSLLQNGFQVAAYDQRGHGRSWRKPSVRDDLSLTHVDHFEEYVEDLWCVWQQLVREMPAPHLLFAHSMGGAVSSLFLEQHPGIIDRAVLSSPMIEVNSRGIPVFACKLICLWERLLGRADKRVFFSKPYAGKEDFETPCATGRARFDWYEDVRTAHPEFQNNGPSYSWSQQSLLVTKKILAPGAPEGIDCPVQLYSAENDSEVMPEAQQQFVCRLRQGRFIPVPGSRHEIYRSEDDVLFSWWRDVLTFLKNE